MKLKEIFNKENRRKVVKATVLTAVAITGVSVPILTYLCIKEHKKCKMLEAKLDALSTTQPPQ